MSDESRNILPKKAADEAPSSSSVFIVRSLVTLMVLALLAGTVFGINNIETINIPFIGQQREIDTENSTAPEDIDAYILDSYYLMREYIADRDTEDLHAAVAYPAMVVVLTDGKGQCQDALVATIGDEVRFHMEPLSAPYAC